MKYKKKIRTNPKRRDYEFIIPKFRSKKIPQKEITVTPVEVGSINSYDSGLLSVHLPFIPDGPIFASEKDKRLSRTKTADKRVWFQEFHKYNKKHTGNNKARKKYLDEIQLAKYFGCTYEKLEQVKHKVFCLSDHCDSMHRYMTHLLDSHCEATTPDWPEEIAEIEESMKKFNPVRKMAFYTIKEYRNDPYGLPEDTSIELRPKKRNTSHIPFLSPFEYTHLDKKLRRTLSTDRASVYLSHSSS